MNTIVLLLIIYLILIFLLLLFMYNAFGEEYSTDFNKDKGV